MLGMALSVIALSGCSNEEQLSLDGTAEARTPLAISVSNAGLTKVGGVVSGSQFDDGASLGLFLTKEDGSSAYDTPYNNVKYTSSTSSGNQTWTATTPILLTGTKANVYAYYPYNSSYTDITAIPINVTENKDVMWATPATNIYNASPTATLPMNHALSVIRFSLSKGDYSGAGSIESISIQGDCMAKTGTLNALTGTVNITDQGAEIGFGALGAASTLSTTATTVEQLVIPTTTSGPIKVTIKMDGKTFEATSSATVSTEKSKAYKFGLAFSDSKLTMSTVSIGAITEEDQGSMTPIVQNNPWKNVLGTDGVYAIKADGSPVAYADASDASYAGVGFVVNGKAYQISNVGLSGIYWWKTDYSDIGSLTNYISADGSNLYGYLNGSTPALSQDYTTWYSTTSVLSDFNGKDNTEKIIEAIGGTTENSIAKATVDFRAGSSNQGYDDWHVPSCGELAYIYLKGSEINTLLGKCGGTTLPTNYHWSSSECRYDRAWYVNFSNGLVNNNYDKNNFMYVRFLRDITE